MKKIKEIWINNKVMVVLVSILILCFIAIVVVAMTYFLGGDLSVYGDRLENADSYVFKKNDQEEYISSFDEIETVDNVRITEKGRVLYIYIDFEGNVLLDDAKLVTSDSLERIDVNLLDYYDINFIMNSPDIEDIEGFNIMGAKNVVADVVSWNNNKDITEEEGE